MKYIIPTIVVVALAIVVITVSKKEHSWEYDRHPSATGTEPYDLALFDGLLEKSLDNGYSVEPVGKEDILLAEYHTDSVKLLDIDIENFDPDLCEDYFTMEAKSKYEGEQHTFFEDESDDDKDTVNTTYNPNDRYYRYISLGRIEKASTDTALLVVMHQPTSLYNRSTEVKTLTALMNFADRGGKAAIVAPTPLDLHRNPFITDPERGIYFTHSNRMEPGSFHDLSSDAPEYSKEWLESRDSGIFRVEKDSGHIMLDKWLTTRILLDDDYPARYYQNCARYIYERAPYRIDKILYPYDKWSSVFDRDPAYALVLNFPRTGGRLVISTLNLYFTNLGVTQSEGVEVIDDLMSRIDDRHVVRLDIDESKSTIPLPYASESNMSVVKTIHKNPALKFAWFLAIATALLLLTRGLVRTRPVDRSGYVPVDKTDAVAVREAKFFRSPQLHFLFQCSWLYNGRKDYKELFILNYLRLARSLKKTCGIELKTASSEEIETAATTVALSTGADKKKLYQDILWMRDIYVNELEYDLGASIDVKQYRRSQKIVEQCPFA